MTYLSGDGYAITGAGHALYVGDVVTLEDLQYWEVMGFNTEGMMVEQVDDNFNRLAVTHFVPAAEVDKIGYSLVK